MSARGHIVKAVENTLSPNEVAERVDRKRRPLLNLSGWALQTKTGKLSASSLNEQAGGRRGTCTG